jgi:hypothetical protein
MPNAAVATNIFLMALSSSHVAARLPPLRTTQFCHAIAQSSFCPLVMVICSEGSIPAGQPVGDQLA